MVEKYERWSFHQTKMLLDAVNDAIKDNPEKFEKPVATIFYNTIKENNAELEKFKWKAMRDKIRHLKLKYKAAIDWRNQTGQESGEASVKEHIMKICPFFDELDKAFGSQANINSQSPFDSVDEMFLDYLDEPLISMREVNGKDGEDKLKLEQSPAEKNDKLEDRKLKLQLKEDVENKKRKLQEETEGTKIEMENKKLLLEDKRLDLEEKKITFETQLKNKELDNAMEIEKYKIDKEYELKVLELKLKYKNIEQ